jgi:hypothetical protein
VDTRRRHRQTEGTDGDKLATIWLQAGNDA